jgi:segregation and condensation protein A
MLLPKEEENEEDPRATLQDALIRYQQAKEAAAKLSPLYAYYSGRMVKDTDEISVDKTYVHDQDVASLCIAIRRIIAYNNALEKATNTTFKPMISKPIIPVEIKIVSIIKKVESNGISSIEDLLVEETTLPDIIASFLGILELIKIRKLLIADEIDDSNALLKGSTRLIVNTDDSSVEENEYIDLVSDKNEEGTEL